MSTRTPAPGEDAWEIGGRRFVRLPGEQVVWQFRRWTLVYCPTRSWNGSVGFRLFLDDSRQRKRTWSLTLAANDFKGIGFMPGPEPTKLMQQWPEVAGEVITQMRQFVGENPRAGWWRNENETGFVAMGKKADRPLSTKSRSPRTKPTGGAP
jgi:hypothetical protein